MYTITIEIDLCNFPAIWAVLSIFLDTQSNTLQYVKSLQQAVNNYYDKCLTDFMSRLEHQASNIMKAMYDSVNNDNFDSVSGDTVRHNLTVHCSVTSFIIQQPIQRPRLLESVYKPMHTSHLHKESCRTQQ